MISITRRRNLLVAARLFIFSASASHGQVVLNEVCAENAGAAVTPAGTTPDYIELFNTGSASVSLTTWSLTDDSANPTKFQFPPTAIIPSKGRLVVWLDTDTTYPGIICTNFALKISGEQVQLYEGLNLRDTVAFGPQIAATPLSRVPDGSGTWQLGSATPGQPNVA